MNESGNERDMDTGRLDRERPRPDPEYREHVSDWIDFHARVTPSRETQRTAAVALGAVGLVLALLAILGAAGAGPLG